jgi:hypothetical protein
MTPCQARISVGVPAASAVNDHDKPYWPNHCPSLLDISLEAAPSCASIPDRVPKHDRMQHSGQHAHAGAQHQCQEVLVHASGAMQQHGKSSSSGHLQHQHQQQEQEHLTHLLDVPAYLLEPHMQHLLEPQDRAALLQSSKELAELALRTAPSLQFNIGLNAQGQVCELQQRAFRAAAWAISHCPALTLRVHCAISSSTSSNSSSGTQAAGSSSAELSAAQHPHPLMSSPSAWLPPRLGQVLTSLVLEVGDGTMWVTDVSCGLFMQLALPPSPPSSS